jgi:urease accessory protein
MIRATTVQEQHHWAQPAADFLLDLEAAVALRGGDALVLEDGRLVEVVAAPEPLLEIRGSDPLHLVRLAWHLGNRHLPTQIMGKGLRIRRDHVIEEMLKGLGARVIEIDAPFDPEGGAYAGGRAHEATGATHAHGAYDHGAHDHHDHHVHDEHCDHDHHHGHAHARDRK